MDGHHGGDVGGCARRKNRKIIMMRLIWTTESHAKEKTDATKDRGVVPETAALHKHQSP